MRGVPVAPSKLQDCSTAENRGLQGINAHSSTQGFSVGLSQINSRIDYGMQEEHIPAAVVELRAFREAGHPVIHSVLNKMQ